MKQLIKNYFTFNTRDRNAFIVLLLVLLGIILAPYIVKWVSKEQAFDYSTFRNDIVEYELEQKRIYAKDSADKAQKESFNYFNIESSVTASELKPFKFNPNRLSHEKWQQLGLSDRQIKGIKNFEAKGGTFQIKSDFKKMYVISDQEYEILEPYIDLPEKYPSKAKYTYKPVEKISIELNNADSVILKSLRGIGPVLSKKIVRYRNRLGGFINKEQLLEINGIDSSLFESISPYLTLEPRLVFKINVNTAELKDFKGHPYISNNVALSMINYRNMHGEYKELSDIMLSALVTEEIFYKISPYLTIGPF